MKKIWLLATVLFVVALALTGCSSQKVTLEIAMSDFAFTPRTLEVPAGAEITLHLTNNGALLHEMVIMIYGKEATAPFDEDDESNIYWEHELEHGEKATVTFTAPSEPGEYQLVCGIPAHIEQGMVGTLIVK